nr:hypothetical protein [Halobacterium sp. CBA1126]
MGARDDVDAFVGLVDEFVQRCFRTADEVDDVRPVLLHRRSDVGVVVVVLDVLANGLVDAVDAAEVVLLACEVHEKDVVAVVLECSAEVGCGGAFADAAFVEVGACSFGLSHRGT